MAEVAGGDRTIVVTTENAAPEAHVVVRDSGPGFRAGCDDLIFEPFFTTKPAGMGMGLAISRSIVEGHGGSIRAVNHPGGGAVVHVTLPVSSNAA
jgi:signal transduction histidine kinase